MRSIGIVAVAACLALGSCAALQKLSSVNVPVKAIIVAGNGVDGAETAATAYIRLCAPNPSPAGCNDSVIKTKIYPAVMDIRKARNAAEQFVLDNPDAKLGPSTLIDAVTKSVGALQDILNANNVPFKS